jgi:hypothetical protein
MLCLADNVDGFWWLWPHPIVLDPWEAPATWGELRLVARRQGIDADAFLRWLLRWVRGKANSNLLLLGYPVALRIGASTTEIHWDALVLPQVPGVEGMPPHGFRRNKTGWWHRDRCEIFQDKRRLRYLRTENWSPDRLQSRGRLPSQVRDSRVVLIGLGALGSVLAEMLVRAGVYDITLVDGELLEAGNVCRHTATLSQVGTSKVAVVAERLRQISPAARVTEIPDALQSSATAIVQEFDNFDVIIDCTASDAVLAVLASAWWPIPRIFASFSIGYAGKRVFSFGMSGHQFPQDEFATNLRPWLEQDGNTWDASEEVLEGAGCWSPLFPARYDDVVLAASTCVKELELLVAKRPLAPRFRVFTQESSDEGFQGFHLEYAPPSSEAITP